MANQTRTPRFADGQRVKVVLLRDGDEPRYRLPADYTKYDGRIGYVMESRVDSFARRGERRFTPCYGYEVMMAKTSDTLQLPEDCLEPAEPYRAASY